MKVDVVRQQKLCCGGASNTFQDLDSREVKSAAYPGPPQKWSFDLGQRNPSKTHIFLVFFKKKMPFPI
jgi:hypothetical protein